MLSDSLKLPAKLQQAAEKCAARQGISLEQFIIWAIAEKVGVLSQPVEDFLFPNITYRRGAGGELTPILKFTGIRVQTLVIAHQQWGLSLAEIAIEYDLSEVQVHEALAFYETHKEEIEKAILAEKGLEENNV